MPPRNLRFSVRLCMLLAVSATPILAQGQDNGQLLIYSLSNKPAATTTGKSSIEVDGFNIFRFNGVISVQSVVVEPPPNPFQPTHGGGGSGTNHLTSIQDYQDRIKLLNDALNGEAKEADQYKAILKEFPGKLLSKEQQDKAVRELVNALKDSQDLVENSDVTSVRNDWNTSGLHDVAVENALKALEATISTPETKATMSFLAQWRPRAEYARDPSHWVLGPTPLKCEAQWFGRTDSQAISLITTDQKDDAPSESSTTLTTNACVPALTISSGLGISTVRSSTYAFTSKTDYSLSPPSSSQVIGYSADQSVIPIYVIQMNYGIGPARSLQAHVSGGVGVSSSGSSTNADFFVGPAFSFLRRAIFVTPALHLTQRQTLQDGYQVGDPKADLSSVPVINRWKYGFAVTFTFPVLSK